MKFEVSDLRLDLGLEDKDLTYLRLSKQFATHLCSLVVVSSIVHLETYLQGEWDPVITDTLHLGLHLDARASLSVEKKVMLNMKYSTEFLLSVKK